MSAKIRSSIGLVPRDFRVFACTDETHIVTENREVKGSRACTRGAYLPNHVIEGCPKSFEDFEHIQKQVYRQPGEHGRPLPWKNWG